MRRKPPLILFLASVGFSHASAEDFLPQVKPLLEKYCIDCHDSTDAKGEIDLETLLFEKPDQLTGNGDLLERLRRVIDEGEMPPAKKKRQPTAGERQKISSALASIYLQLAETQRDDPGKVVMSRLSRQQYRNALRDLSGGVLLTAGKYLPNEGGAGEGFDNVGLAQSMGASHVEKYIEAARISLQHLRVNPVDGLHWSETPLLDVIEPAAQRLAATNDILDWYRDQQYLWAYEYDQSYKLKYGSQHGPYLWAAWRYHHRKGDESFADLAAGFEPSLGPVILEKWYRILSAANPKPPFVGWARAWAALPAPGKEGDLSIRERCNLITEGRDPNDKSVEDTYAPPYELSFREGAAREATIRSAKEDKVWPFDIEIGDAKELFLVATQGGDDNLGDLVLWQKGVFHFADGSTKPWHVVTKMRGANSGLIYQWGRYNSGPAKLRADAFGATPPGAMKINVPKGAVRLVVEAAVDTERTSAASVQTLVLKEKPPGNKQRFFPGRMIFGGKSGGIGRGENNRELVRALQRANVPSANRTKAGLNAERNALAEWRHTEVKWIGGPWDHQELDREDPDSPYFMTVKQVRKNAKPKHLEELAKLESRLVALAQVPHQKILHELAAKGIDAREGVIPPGTSSPHLEALRKQEILWESRVKTWFADVANLAWKRDVRESELESIVRLYGEARAAGLSFDTSVKQSLMAILVSPHFLYTQPLNEADHAGPLTDGELASRLAFLIWQSLPDAELLKTAEKKNLSGTEELKRQVRRMLEDGRSRALAEGFAAQAYGFAGFETYGKPDPELYPEFTPELRSAMLREVVSFHHHLFKGQAPLTDLIQADYTFANGELASHYSLAKRWGRNEWKRTSLPRDRGGLPGMALFLTKNSEPLRTSPVLRGTWLLEKFLGRELANPPAGIPAISQDEKDEQGRAVGEQLKAHRANATCAACHDKIDPLGIALERYDPIGRIRKSYRDGSPLVTKAETADGTELDGYTALKTYLSDRQDDVMAHFIRKFVGYSLGRAVEPGDHFLLQRLKKEFPKNDYRFPWLLEQVVLSPQFLNKNKRSKK